MCLWPAVSQPCKAPQFSPVWPSAVWPGPSPHTPFSASPSVSPVSSLHPWGTSKRTQHCWGTPTNAYSVKQIDIVVSSLHDSVQVSRRLASLGRTTCWDCCKEIIQKQKRNTKWFVLHQQLQFLPAGWLAAAPPEPWSCFSAGLQSSEPVWVRKEMSGCHAVACRWKMNGWSTRLCDSLTLHCLRSQVHKGNLHHQWASKQIPMSACAATIHCTECGNITYKFP